MKTVRVTLVLMVPVLLVATVVALDIIAGSRRWDVLIAGLLDEPAHLATALVVLLAIAGPRWSIAHRRFTVAALVASVAIDVDHIPLYARVPHIAVDGGRPFTHSISTVLVLLALALPLRSRPVMLGLAAGVGLHLFRDLASGPGVSLFWPLYFPGFHLRYGIYAALLVVAALAATLRMTADRRVLDAGDSTVAADVETSTATGTV